jgi:hypothetical protein
MEAKMVDRAKGGSGLKPGPFVGAVFFTLLLLLLFGLVSHVHW